MTGSNSDHSGNRPTVVDPPEYAAGVPAVVEVLRQATSNAAELLALTNSRNPYKDGPLGVVPKRCRTTDVLAKEDRTW